jgi:dTDP-4-amino-4,6-dideoxygalactose transaminase
MKIKFSALDKQHQELLPQLLAATSKVLSEGNFILGDDVKKFEQSFANYHDINHAIGVASGTDALILALRALDIGPGDEVITSVNTFITSVSSIALVGAKPILIDAGADDNIDVNKIETAITPATKAIMPVHWTGKPCDMDAILSISNKYDIPIIEDCAQAISAKYKGKLVGTFGKIGCFSLHPFKTLNACGDAGIIITDDELLADRIRALRNNGFSKDGKCIFWSSNSRLDTLQASYLNIKFDHFERWTSQRIQIAEYYTQHLSHIYELQLPTLPTSNDDKYAFHTYIIKAKNRDQLQKHLFDNHIETRLHYKIPIYKHEIGQRTLDHTPDDFPQMNYISDHCLSLPIYSELSQDDLKYIVNSIEAFYQTTKQSRSQTCTSHIPT